MQDHRQEDQIRGVVLKRQPLTRRLYELKAARLKLGAREGQHLLGRFDANNDGPKVVVQSFTETSRPTAQVENRPNRLGRGSRLSHTGRPTSHHLRRPSLALSYPLGRLVSSYFIRNR